MKTWKGTSTLDGLIDGIEIAAEKSVADVLLIGGKKIELDEYPCLQGIFKTGVGIDNLPFQAAEDRGIQIGMPSDDTKDIIFEETANFSCHLILRCLYRNTGEFTAWRKLPRSSLKSSRLLVIGTGNIGHKVCRKMRGFCDVADFDIARNKLEELEPLVRLSDCISLHIPLTETTKGFFNSERLGWMKNGAAIVNTSRGHVIEQDAIFSELESGRIFAAIDVFWDEPYGGPLTNLSDEQVLLTPHVASTCQQFLTETASDFRNFIAKLES